MTTTPLESLIDLQRNVPNLEQFDVIHRESSTKFGRHIGEQLHDLTSKGRPVTLQYSRRDAAVVITPETYKRMEKMEKLVSRVLSELVNDQNESILTASSIEFDELFRKMTHSNSADASQHLLNVTDEELSSTFKPGLTEKQ